MRADKHQANIEQTKIAGVKEPIFYYVYGANNSRITTCLLVNIDNWSPNTPILISKGISICSNKDNFSKKEGRAKAYGRAIKAFINRHDSIPFKGTFLSLYNPRANEREINITEKTMLYQQPRTLFKEDTIILSHTQVNLSSDKYK